VAKDFAPARWIIETANMVDAETEIGLATRDDIAGMLALQEENLIARGGLLSFAFRVHFLKRRSVKCR
jgi:hypothetical protein